MRTCLTLKQLKQTSLHFGFSWKLVISFVSVLLWFVEGAREVPPAGSERSLASVWRVGSASWTFSRGEGEASRNGRFPRPSGTRWRVNDRARGTPYSASSVVSLRTKRNPTKWGHVSRAATGSPRGSALVAHLASNDEQLHRDAKTGTFFKSWPFGVDFVTVSRMGLRRDRPTKNSQGAML